MPRLVITLPENSQSVSRPVITSVIQQLQTYTKIPKDSKIFYPGDNSRMQTSGSSLDSVSRDAIFNTGRFTFIEVTEDYGKSTLGSTATRAREHIPIFKDTSLGVYIKPIYSTTNVVISIKYRGASETEVKRWYDDLRIAISELKDINLHTVQYHYPINNETIALLKEIYEKRETVAPYKQSFIDYLSAYSVDRLTVATDLTGANMALVVQETQTRIQGLYTFDGLPNKPERDDATGTWSISFEYKFDYDKPIECVLQYPIIVHNQLLDPKFIDFSNTGTVLDYVNLSAPVSIAALHHFEAEEQFESVVDHDPIIRIPPFDDFTPENVPNGTGTVMLALAEVDTSDAVSLFNLRELGDIVLDEDVLQFIQQSEYPYISKYFQSIIQISLYRNGKQIEPGAVFCDRNLNLKLKSLADLRKTHRVRLALVTNLTLLSQDALDRLKLFPKAYVKIIGALNELLRNNPDFNKLGDKKRISALDFNAIYRFITGQGEYGRSNYGGSINWSDLNSVPRAIADIPSSEFNIAKLTMRRMKTVLATNVTAARY